METNLAYKFEEEPREEVINGKVVMMSAPTLNHTLIAGNIFGIFRDYLRGKKCVPIQDGGALFLEEDAEEYKPDMMVVCDRDKLKLDGVHGAPDLAVEVLSPSTGRYDKGHKKEVYEKRGVREYWIVDPANRAVEQYVLQNGRFVLRDVYHLYPDYLLRHMTEEKKAALVTEFKCSLFDDLTIRLDDVFFDVIPGV